MGPFPYKLILSPPRPEVAPTLMYDPQIVIYPDLPTSYIFLTFHRILTSTLDRNYLDYSFNLLLTSILHVQDYDILNSIELIIFFFPSSNLKHHLTYSVGSHPHPF